MPSMGLCLSFSSRSLWLGPLPRHTPTPSSCSQNPSKLDEAFPGGNNVPDWKQKALPRGSGSGCHGGGCPAQSQAVLGKGREVQAQCAECKRLCGFQHSTRMFEATGSCLYAYGRAQLSPVRESRVPAHVLAFSGKVNPSAAVTLELLLSVAKPGGMELKWSEGIEGRWEQGRGAMGAHTGHNWVAWESSAGPTAAPWHCHSHARLLPKGSLRGEQDGVRATPWCTNLGRSHPTGLLPQVGRCCPRAPHVHSCGPQHTS